MSSGHGSPALIEVIEEEPEVNRVECTGIILTRNIRFEAVVVAGLVIARESRFDSTFDRTDRCIEIAVMFISFGEREEFARLILEDGPCLGFEVFL